MSEIDSAKMDAPSVLAAAARLAEIAAALAPVPKQTQTEGGRPADPVNIAFAGSGDKLTASLMQQGWVRAELSLRCGVEYGADTFLHKVTSMHR